MLYLVLLLQKETTRTATQEQLLRTNDKPNGIANKRFRILCRMTHEDSGEPVTAEEQKTQKPFSAETLIFLQDPSPKENKPTGCTADHFPVTHKKKNYWI